MVTDRQKTATVLLNAGFRVRNRLYDPDWVRGPGLGNTCVQLAGKRYTMWGEAADLSSLLAGPTLTPAETQALDWAMNLMGDCNGATTLAGLLVRACAAPSPVAPEPGDTVRNTSTGRSGVVVKVDGILTLWHPDGNWIRVTTCTALLAVVKKAPQNGEEAKHP